MFRFFADAANLEALTPEWVGFHILTPLPVAMRVGALIQYRLRIHRLPVSWTTIITAWDPPFRFVDEQLKGPYRAWVHEHVFEDQAGGTLVKDNVGYRVWGGRLVDALFVRRDVKTIFDFRRRRLEQLFATANERE